MSPADRLERGLRAVLVLIAVATVLSGAVQLLAPGFVLAVLNAESRPASRHFFAIVGMFMVLFGGLLLHALRRPRESSAALLWTGLQKLGACLAVGLGVARGLFSPLALGVAGFDLLSGLLILGYLGRVRRAASRPEVTATPRPERRPPAPAPQPAWPPAPVAVTQGRRRSLVLAGGGMRVAWQAGALRALHEAGLRFAHVDGTSGGIINTAMLLSGLSPEEMCERWRTLRVKDFVSLMPPEDYARPWDMEALGDADGLVRRVFPHLGIDVDAIRANASLEGTFNVCNFSRKTNEAIPHTFIDTELLVAGISLPLFMPAVRKDGAFYTDSVWILDANPLEAVRRGAEELWVLWCIGNTPEYERGFFRQYVHMIEMSANGALFEQLERIREINARILAGETVWGHQRPIIVHLIKPERPLPLDPDFYAGHITADSLIDLGYADASGYLRTRPEQGLPLTPEITQMPAREPDLVFREKMSGPLALGESEPLAGAGKGRRTPFTFHVTTTIDDMDAFVNDASHPARLAAHISYPPFGEDIPIKRGDFNLFKSTDDPRVRLMTYGMLFEAQGREYFLSGTKTVRDDSGFDLWRDTTRLYCRLHEGSDERGRVVGAGVLRLGLRDVLGIVRGMRSSRPGLEGAQMVARFGKLFLGSLWELYLPRARPDAAEQPQGQGAAQP